MSERTSNDSSVIISPFFIVVCTTLRNNFQQYKYEEAVQTINRVLSYFELLQELSKTAGQFWVEIEYTIKAFDELNMCKMRILLAKENQDEVHAFEVHDHEIADRIIEQRFELHDLQRKFNEKLSRLKFIRELGKEYMEKKEKPECPICRRNDYNRVSSKKKGFKVNKCQEKRPFIRVGTKKRNRDSCRAINMYNDLFVFLYY